MACLYFFSLFQKRSLRLSSLHWTTYGRKRTKSEKNKVKKMLPQTLSTGIAETTKCTSSSMASIGSFRKANGHPITEVSTTFVAFKLTKSEENKGLTCSEKSNQSSLKLQTASLPSTCELTFCTYKLLVFLKFRVVALATETQWAEMTIICKFDWFAWIIKLDTFAEQLSGFLPPRYQSTFY